MDRRGIEPREEYALARMARLAGALRVVGGEIADGKLCAAPQDRYHGVQVHEPRGLRRPSSGASRHLLQAKRLFDSHISAGQFRAIFDGVKFLQPAIEDAWSWFAVVSGPGAEAGDD
ncbi:MAG TPA: hypothetical protein VII20_12425, partial [Roseiarcus sp.]